MSTFTTESVKMLFDSAYEDFALNVLLNVGICISGAIIEKELISLMGS